MKELLDELIKVHGSAEALSRASGVAPATISRLRSGKRRLTTLEQLRGLLGATGNLQLQMQLLEVSGISAALSRGQERDA